MKGFDLPSFLTGLLDGAMIALIIVLTGRPAAATGGAEAAIFRACAVQAREHGDKDAEDLFRAAARHIGGTALLPNGLVTRSTCLAMRATAELYRPVEQKDREWPTF